MFKDKNKIDNKNTIAATIAHLGHNPKKRTGELLVKI